MSLVAGMFRGFGCCDWREGEPKAQQHTQSEAKPVVRGVIGIVFGQRDPNKAEFHVDKINPGSAADDDGGVRVGDVLVQVDNIDIKSSKLLVGRIKGAAGTALVLTLRDVNTSELKRVVLQRRPADDLTPPTPTSARSNRSSTHRASRGSSIASTPRNSVAGTPRNLCTPQSLRAALHAQHEAGTTSVQQQLRISTTSVQHEPHACIYAASPGVHVDIGRPNEAEALDEDVVYTRTHALSHLDHQFDIIPTSAHHQFDNVEDEEMALGRSKTCQSSSLRRAQSPTNATPKELRHSDVCALQLTHPTLRVGSPFFLEDGFARSAGTADVSPFSSAAAKMEYKGRSSSESPISAATTAKNSPMPSEADVDLSYEAKMEQKQEGLLLRGVRAYYEDSSSLEISRKLQAASLSPLTTTRHPDATEKGNYSEKQNLERRATTEEEAQGGDAAVRVFWHQDTENDDVFRASRLGHGMHEQHKALHWAARYGHVPTIKRLSREGVDLDVPAEDLTTAVMRAARYGNDSTIRELVAFYCIKYLTSCTGRYGHAAAIRELVKCGASVDLTDTGGCTALMWAARAGRLAAVRALLECNASADVQSESGWTAMMLAATNWQTEVVTLLVESGADVHLRNSDGDTALQIALENARRMACLDDVVGALQ